MACEREEPRAVDDGAPASLPIIVGAPIEPSAVSTRRIGQVDVAVIARTGALALVLTAVAERRPFLLCFANAHTINMAGRLEAFAQALTGALVLNDGVGVDLASRWLYGRAFTDNLNGTDFTPELLSRLPRGTRVFLLGGLPGVAERAAAAICQRHPHLAIVAAEHGFFDEAEESALVNRIGESKAEIVLAAMGHPRQEIWAARHVVQLRATVLCVGALLDFYAGTARRAPLWVRRARTEWAYRLLREPRRLWRRYLIGNVAFLVRMIGSERREGEISPKSI